MALWWERGEGQAGGHYEKLRGAGKEFPVVIVGQSQRVGREPPAIISHLHEVPTVVIRSQEEHRFAGIDGRSLQAIVLKGIVLLIPSRFHGKETKIGPADCHRSPCRYCFAKRVEGQ